MKLKFQGMQLHETLVSNFILVETLRIYEFRNKVTALQYTIMQIIYFYPDLKHKWWFICQVLSQPHLATKIVNPVTDKYRMIDNKGMSVV